MKKISYLLFFIFILNSCGVNEEIAGESKSKSTTYTQKVDIDEVLTQLKNRNPELALFIESNPVSNLKTKSGKTDYYFDLKNVYAIKNDKNEAAYTIPLYIDSEDQSNYLHRLSVEITPTNVDVKLVIIEGMDDGSLRYTAHSFDIYKKKSLTSKTAQIDCYCVTVVSDCTCHKTHAASGCDHPSVSVTCDCSGSGYTGTGSPPVTGTKTSWNGGSGSSTSYTPTSGGVIFGLQKHFKPEYTISPLIKYTIEQNVTYGKMLLDFLNEETSTPVNKAFVIQMLLDMENGQFTTTKQIRNSIENFKYSQKSPFNVDLSSILDNSTLPEFQKFIEVYKALSNSPEFKNLFLAIFENNAKHNVKFEIGNLDGGASGDTKTILLDLTNNLITIDANFIKNNSKLVVAKTILHECIHAYLNVKLCDAGEGMSIPAINDLDFYNIVNQKYNGFNGDQEQHNFIYNFMLPTMKIVLADVKDKLVSPAESEFLQGLVFHPESPSIDVNFSWEDFYQNLVLGGLQDCVFFKNEIATIIKDPQTGENKAVNTIDQIKLNYYSQYQTYANYLSK